MRPSQRHGLPWREVDGCTVIVVPDRGEIHELDPVGSFLWRHADGSLSVEEIARALGESFEVESALALTDAADFFSELKRLSLIDWKE